jgi:hypothetical protein
MPALKGNLAANIMMYHRVSCRQVSKMVKILRSTQQYRSKLKDDATVIEALEITVQNYSSIGFWQFHHRIRLDGQCRNHKWVYWIYSGLQLNNCPRSKKRLPGRIKHYIQTRGSKPSVDPRLYQLRPVRWAQLPTVEYIRWL